MISVVVPTYNEEMNIVKCLKFLNNQSIPRKNYEIIVVDGHSNDKTVQLAKKYANKVIQQKSKGVGGARNDGVAVAKGDIIATTDADCIVTEDWLEKIQSKFKKHKNVACVYGPIKPIEREIKYRIYLVMNNMLSYVLYHLHLVYMTIGANTAFRKKEFLDIGGYADYSAGDDYEMPFRLKKKGKILFDKKVFVYFSMRRYELFGTIKSIYVWIANVMNAVFKTNKKVQLYNRVDYE
ncbi:MAG: glycosyltransferase [archaeon]|nr:glycosyltransferase [archaeon]